MRGFGRDDEHFGDVGFSKLIKIQFRISICREPNSDTVACELLFL